MEPKVIYLLDAQRRPEWENVEKLREVHHQFCQKVLKHKSEFLTHLLNCEDNFGVTLIAGLEMVAHTFSTTFSTTQPSRLEYYFTWQCSWIQ